MTKNGLWLINLAGTGGGAGTDGVVAVGDYVKVGRPPEEVAIMEKAAHYGADAVFFEAERGDKPPVAQAFIFIHSNEPAIVQDMEGRIVKEAAAAPTGSSLNVRLASGRLRAKVTKSIPAGSSELPS